MSLNEKYKINRKLQYVIVTDRADFPQKIIKKFTNFQEDNYELRIINTEELKNNVIGFRSDILWIDYTIDQIGKDLSIPSVSLKNELDRNNEIRLYICN